MQLSVMLNGHGIIFSAAVSRCVATPRRVAPYMYMHNRIVCFSSTQGNQQRMPSLDLVLINSISLATSVDDNQAFFAVVGCKRVS